MTLKKDIKKIMIKYPDLNIKSANDYTTIVNIYNILESAHGNVNGDILKIAFDDRENLNLINKNDYLYLVLKSTIEYNKKFKKVAYPNFDSNVGTIQEEFDLGKWASIVHKIYDTVYSGKMSLEDAIAHYSNSLDKDREEDVKFKNWIAYYQKGENLKYSEKKEALKKKADYDFSLMGSGPYSSEVFPDLEELKNLSKLKNLKPEKEQGTISAPQAVNEYTVWKNKLYSAVRRLDKLIRESDNYVDIESQRDIARLLHDFNLEIMSLRQQTTASDLAYNLAGKFKKRGFTEGYNVLTKFAQEVPEQVDYEPEDLAPEITAPAKEAPVAQPGVEPLPEGISEDEKSDAQKDVASGGLQRALAPNSRAKPGEYELLAGDVDINMASAKLEEVAATLSDRRIIRYLAEFDIMLDKIGIAAMFPELSEAQSRLIDSYSYALTRVTKMLGMLSSGKDLAEITNARTQEMTNKTMKEVDKTFNPPQDESKQESKKQNLQEEFGGEKPAEVAEKPAAMPKESPQI
jgi:uncharacterized protein YwgA